MTRRRAHLARRTIPVAVAAPVQLPLALAWEQPIDRAALTRDPEPAEPAAVAAVAIRREQAA